MKDMLQGTYTRRSVLAGAGIAATMAGLMPHMFAYADTDADIAAVKATLESLGSELATIQQNLQDAGASLEGLETKIAQTQDEIESTSDKLHEKRTELGGQMKSSYKGGSAGFLDVVLGAHSIDDLISGIYYLDKVADDQAKTIDEVNQLAAQLESDKAALEASYQDQKAQLENLQTQYNAYQAKVSEAQSQLNSLDEQKRQALASSSSNVQTAVAAVETQTTAQQATGNQTIEVISPNQTTGDNTSNQGSSQQTNQNTSSNNNSQSSQQQQSKPNVSNPNAGQGVATAMSCIGWPYVYGGASPADGGFDCSGLVCYSFGYKYGRTTWSMSNGLKAAGRFKTSVSELAYGDLVFEFGFGHVGIYIGGGQIVHAPVPGRNVCIEPIYSFCGGGTY